jgi:hypothetical protein
MTPVSPACWFGEFPGAVLPVCLRLARNAASQHGSLITSAEVGCAGGGPTRFAEAPG